MFTREYLSYFRVGFIIILILGSAPLVYNYLDSRENQEGTVEGAPVEVDNIPEYDGRIAVTSDGWGPGYLAVYNATGAAIYTNSSYDRYRDVDPGRHGDNTIVYAASSDRSDECPRGVKCTLNVFERLNLTTGETERVWTQYYKIDGSGETHDIDQVGENGLLIAQIAWNDRVYRYNTSTGMTEWGWTVQQDLSLQTGGQLYDDWTHLNDIEQLPDGRVMVSLRNQDQVVFVDPETGLQPSWTLGEEDNYSTLYEQHNPDYIPASQGGPAVLVGDSQNRRIIEYQRVDGEWERSWVWQDSEIAVPRDADRLPGGRTLITDSGGNRLLIVNKSGSIIWQQEFSGPYEAELLGTPPESAGGESAAQLGLDSKTTTERESGGDSSSGQSLLFTLLPLITGVWPTLLTDAVLFVAPSWVGLTAAAGTLYQGVVVILWIITELYYSGVEIQITQS